MAFILKTVFDQFIARTQYDLDWKRLSMTMPTHNGFLVLSGSFIFCLAAGVFAYWKRTLLNQWMLSVGEFFSPRPTKAPTNWSLFCVSFVGLYLEVMMIRWIGTEVRVFAYFQNLALIACFLGFGLGCYWSKSRKTLFFSVATIVGLVVLVEAPSERWQAFLTSLSTRLSLSPDAALWGDAVRPGVATGTWTWVLLFAAAVVAVSVFLLLLVVLMIPIGQWVGFSLDHARNPIRAYSANLLGSVAGIWIFAWMAFLRLSPTYWFIAAILVLALVPPFSRRLAVTCATAIVFILLTNQLANRPGVSTYWSPYQKLQVMSRGDGMYDIAVNNTGYMHISNMTDDYLARHPEIAAVYRNCSSYDAPFRFAKGHDRVLIVGAGGGNDAAAALRNGAKQIDAVEIDPVIFSLGEQLHLERPYHSPAVHKVLNDARAFLRRGNERYDVILFGLLDSHTQFSDYSNMRIDNYVYTQEAFDQARKLLKPDGILVVKFEVRNPWTWMGQRFNSMLNHSFGRPPVVFYAGELGRLASATIFIESSDPSLWTRSAQPPLSEIVARNPPAFSLEINQDPPRTTDDWPYVYHRGHFIPRTYFTVSLILLALAVLLVRGTLEPRRASTWQFCFLGAGFLLLETQMISRLALYFGTTWLVNCVALTAILLVLVLANVIVARERSRHLGLYYALLVISMLGNYLFPWHMIPYSAMVVGVLLGVTYSISVFFAGIIFTESFRRYSEKSSAFGANIVGAVAGGLAQNLSFIFGMKALLIFAAVFYCSAAIIERLPATQPLGTMPAQAVAS